MKVCFLLGGFYQNGGIGRVTSVLANRLSETDEFGITVLGYYNPQKPNIYDISPRIKQCCLLENYQSMSKFLLTNGEAKLRRFLVEHDIDVLVACGALFFPVSVRACRKIKTKCICWEHSNPEGNADHRGQNAARKYGIKRADLNVVLTRRALKIYRDKYGAENTIQIYNPIDPEVIRNAGQYSLANKKIVSVGRLTYQKYFEAAVEVAARVLPGHPEWEWDVFGQGEDLEKLQAMAEAKGLHGRMHFRGQVTDLYHRYNSYGMMVMTSRYEGFPMTLLEGMGNGLPLVSFDIPTGPDEIIENGVNGYLIQPFDLDRMAESILTLIQQEPLRTKMSQENCSKASAFGEEEIIEEWKDTLRKSAAR